MVADPSGVAAAQEEVSPRPDPNLTRTLANPWRAEILAQLYVRPMSPTQFVEDIGGEISTISRHFRHLAKLGYIEVIDERSGGRRRGGVEHIYRSTQRNQLDTDAWSAMSLDARERWSRNAIAFYLGRITEAVRAGTFDVEIDRHFSWDAITLDRQGWKEVTDRLDEVLDWLPQVESEATQRLSESGEEAIPTTVGLSAFRAPTESEKVENRPPRSSSKKRP